MKSHVRVQTEEYSFVCWRFLHFRVVHCTGPVSTFVIDDPIIETHPGSHLICKGSGGLGSRRTWAYLSSLPGPSRSSQTFLMYSSFFVFLFMIANPCLAPTMISSSEPSISAVVLLQRQRGKGKEQSSRPNRSPQVERCQRR